MKKEVYLQSLEKLLASIPAEDRAEALQFYSDYLEDAGDNVDEVIRSLGTPEELAKSIQKDLYGDNAEGDYTRTSRDLPGTYKVPFSTGGRFSQYEQQTFKESEKAPRKGRLSAGQWILFILLLLCALPVIVPICGALLGLLLAVFAVIVALIFGAGAAGIALVIGAIAIVAVALFKLVISPVTSLIMIGGSLIMFGLGLLGIAITAWIVFRILPKLFVWIADSLSRMLHR